jgi:8-amino-7-oxononanoate synthase
MSPLDDWLHGQLAEIESKHLRRQLRVVASPQQPEIRVNGRQLVNFSSNDYLGLAADARLREAAARAIEAYGAGAGASRLVCGNQQPHAELEAALAAFKRTKAALAFSSGYATALGAVTALVGAADVVILDKLCHACLVDAARLSGAALRVFPHNNLGKLESHLLWARERHPAGNILVVTESVFSMDGDTARLAEIVDLKERHGAWLLVDEAHGVGVIGNNGRGLADELGVADKIEVQMGTLGKALGAAGGYVCGSRALADFLINRARSFIFSTAPGPATVAAAAEAARLLESGEAEPLRERLWHNIRSFADRLSMEVTPASAIIPVILGDESRALEASERLMDAGFLVPAIRFPTVARGSARLRVTLSAAHTEGQIEGLVAELDAFLPIGTAGSSGVGRSE